MAMKLLLHAVPGVYIFINVCLPIGSGITGFLAMTFASQMPGGL